MHRMLPALAIAIVPVLSVGGCGGVRPAPQPTVEPATTAGGASRPGAPMTLTELDQLTKAFADRYATLVVAACDDVERNSPGADQRRTAHLLKLTTISSAYDVVTNPDPFTQLVDLVLVITLESTVWIDEDRAEGTFGLAGAALIGTLRQAREEVWSLASRVMKPEQLQVLDRLIWDWRRDHQDIELVSLVRFDDFSASRGKSTIADVPRGTGLLAPVEEASRAADELRLVAERTFFYAKRLPTLASWQAEGVFNEMLANPDTVAALAAYQDVTAAVARAVALIEGIGDPGGPLAEYAEAVASSRELVADASALTDEVDEILAASERAIGSLRDASRSILETVGAADQLVRRYRTEDGAGPPADGVAAPFDINDYSRAAAELATAVRELNGLVGSTDALLGSEAWSRRLGEVNEAAAARVLQASEASAALVDRLFWRGVALVVVFFAVMTLARVVAARLVPGR
jgi:hypothetical protein